MAVADIYTPELRDYVAELYADRDKGLEGILASQSAAGLPSIEVGQDEGRFLGVIAAAVGARRALEIGTLAGYSGIWIARALPASGQLITLELDPERAALARRHFEQAGVGDKVTVMSGRALDVLPTLADGEPFDLTFIDADKDAYPDYLEWAIRLSRPGAAILAHNVFYSGEVVAPNGSTSSQAVRAFNQRLADDPRLHSTLVPLRDGMSLAIVGPGGPP
jgi:predicted O-methyltransferase YrrM